MIIKHQKGRGTKIHILIDDEYAVTTDENFWCDNYIPDGTKIDEDEWEDLLVKINYKKALNKCGEFLSRREHSVKELKSKLLRTVDAYSAQKAIDRYIEAGYLDDEHFCRSLVDYLFRVKKYSYTHAKQECFKRGVSRDIVENVMSEFEVDNTAMIIDIIQSKYLSKLQQENGRERVIAALQRKGFYYSDIKDALYRIENDEE